MQRPSRERDIVLAFTFIVLVATAGMATAYIDFLGKYSAIDKDYLEQIGELRVYIENLESEVSRLRSQVQTLKVPSGKVNWTGTALALSPETIYEATISSTVKVTARSGDLFNAGVVTGSGFVYSSDGVIVTNSHVVEEASSFQVTFADGTTVGARLLGKDQYSDLAALKVDMVFFPLSQLALVNSSSLRVGQSVYAIGNPFGLSGSITSGMISQLGRSITTSGGYLIVDVIQIDAAINPGNSGGPLLNSCGEVIGVNTAIATTTGTFSGVGFAIPSDLVVRVIPSLIKSGTYKHPWMGIKGMSVTPEIAAAMNLNETRGFLLTSITRGSPAERAGLQGSSSVTTIDGQNILIGGDVIVMIDGVKVRQIEDLLSRIEHLSVGDTVSLTVLRQNLAIVVHIVLGERP